MYKIKKKLTSVSCCFRNHRAESHCKYLHGHDLVFEIEVASVDLDSAGWVFDFGGFSILRAEIERRFDHKTLVAKDDPMMSVFREMQKKDLIQLSEFELTTCEHFAEYTFVICSNLLKDLYVHSVCVTEEGKNSAIYINKEGGMEL